MIYLIGFMGTGKSTVAKELHRLTALPLIDTDKEIEKRTGKSIPEIFATEGEEGFRRTETGTLKELASEDAAIISCGGGLVLREENVAIMKASGTTVLLTARPETILLRVGNDDNRPLLRGKKNVKDIAEMMEGRRPHYEKAADLMISTDGKSPRTIAEEIVSKVDFLQSLC